MGFSSQSLSACLHDGKSNWQSFGGNLTQTLPVTCQLKTSFLSTLPLISPLNQAGLPTLIPRMRGVFVDPH